MSNPIISEYNSLNIKRSNSLIKEKTSNENSSNRVLFGYIPQYENSLLFGLLLRIFGKKTVGCDWSMNGGSMHYTIGYRFMGKLYIVQEY